MFGSRRLERVEQIMRDVHADFGAELREFNAPSRRCGKSSQTCATGTGQAAVVTVVLCRISRAAPISVLRQYIERQNLSA